MKIVVLTMAGFFAAQAADAQIQRQRPSPAMNARMAGDNYMMRVRGDGENRVSAPEKDARMSGKECLETKSTGKVVCHTRAEWQKIAADLDRANR